uniref:Uncharacterized protein n=1 Tax=Anguilla anguilla TaxID=7936 RepID=A0A0E9TWQ8_ANGAN
MAGIWDCCHIQHRLKSSSIVILNTSNTLAAAEVFAD